MLLGMGLPAAGEMAAHPYPAPEVWTPPPIRPEGFQFEIQISSLGTSYDVERVRASIASHGLGEYESAVSPVFAPEWGYSFTHLDGQIDGAGRAIEAGYRTPPADRRECLRAIEAFLHRQYIRGAERPWASMNGHFPWHHYAAEFGFDQIGSEIGENINNYQWHIALNRGAARQYARPWFIDFSAWHGPSITDYSPGRIWGEHSGPDHGHSMSLFERSLFMSYMAGAGQITAEAGGAIAFLPEADERGVYPLSPYGAVCKRFRAFSQAHPDSGTPYTPFAIVLDYFHGAYPGFGPRKAFGYFDYTPGDDMTWRLIDLIWPGGWEVMGRAEAGALVNGPYGDVFDVLLQNAPQGALDSYPCLILSGGVRLRPEEAARYRAYVERGGTLILNAAYSGQFPDYGPAPDSGVTEKDVGAGRVIVYGPAYDVAALDGVIRAELAKRLPIRIFPDVQYLVNVRENEWLLTLINNDGVLKEPRGRPVVDRSKACAVTVTYQGAGAVVSAEDILNGQTYEAGPGGTFTVPLGPGEVAVLRLSLAGKE